MPAYYSRCRRECQALFFIFRAAAAAAFAFSGGLVIYVFLSGSGTPPLLRLLALAWWFLLCVAPVNTGMVGYADILGPLVIIALVLGCMHLAEKRASRQTKG